MWLMHTIEIKGVFIRWIYDQPCFMYHYAGQAGNNDDTEECEVEMDAWLD